MSDEEKMSHAALIESIIDRKMRPFYWIIGGTMTIMLTIYVSIAWPMSDKIIQLNKEVSQKIDAQTVKSEYLTKGNYLFLQAQSHQSDIEAIRNPQNADLIYNKEITEAGRTLDFVSRSGEQIN